MQTTVDTGWDKSGHVIEEVTGVPGIAVVTTSGKCFPPLGMIVTPSAGGEIVVTLSDTSQ